LSKTSILAAYSTAFVSKSSLTFLAFDNSLVGILLSLVLFQLQLLSCLELELLVRALILALNFLPSDYLLYVLSFKSIFKIDAASFLEFFNKIRNFSMILAIPNPPIPIIPEITIVCPCLLKFIYKKKAYIKLSE
jgi:hypothetical protein